MTRQSLQSILDDLVVRFQALYGQRLARLVLFGSQARDEAELGSDIDVMVVLKGKVRPSKELTRAGRSMAALSLKYDSVISCTFVSSERFVKEQSPLLMNARREGATLGCPALQQHSATPLASKL